MNNNNTAPLQESSAVNDSKPNLPKFGNYLREAREASGMSTAEVADRMKLSEDIIKALENSRVDVLPAPAFTQGYIKGYTRLLKIPLDEVMLAYDQMVPEKVQALTANATGKHVQHSHEGRIKWVTYALAAAGFVLFAVWVQQNGMQWIEQGKNALENAENQLAEPVQQDSAPVESQAIAVPPEAPVEVAVEVPVQPIPAPVPVAQQSVVEKKKSEPVRTETISAGEDLLILTASDQSWTEVQDADGNRLFFELMESGDEQRIKGRAPFRVFLGNAPAINIKMNEQPVDIRSYVRQNKIAHVSISAKAVAQSSARTSPTQVSDQFIPAAENNIGD
jgi:cytoskeleton protein RodZ